MGEKEVISFEKYKDKSKPPPVSLQEQSYPVCTDVSPAFILCFQTNGCCETDWESRPTSAYSEVAIRYTENGCGKSSLFREQFVKLTTAIKFARKAWWAQHQTSNLPSVGRCGQIAPRRITQELYWICLGGKKIQQSAASNCCFFFCFIMHAYLHPFLVTRKMEFYYQQVFLAILLVLKLLLLRLEYVGSLLSGDVF